MTDYNRKQMRNVIDDYVVNPKYREVLSLKLCDGMTHEQVAEVTNYSTQHVKHICKAYREMLLSHL